VLAVLLLWAILLALCWPIALLALVLWPIVWLLSIPFRIVGIAAEAFLALIKSILFLPARILDHNEKVTIGKTFNNLR
jgi:hypothetical protein